MPYDTVQCVLSCFKSWNAAYIQTLMKIKIALEKENRKDAADKQIS